MELGLGPNNERGVDAGPTALPLFGHNNIDVRMTLTKMMTTGMTFVPFDESLRRTDKFSIGMVIYKRILNV